MIDSHAHIYLEQFDEDVDQVIARSIAAGVDKIFMPNVDHSTIDQMLAIEHKYPDTVYAMMGLHPCSVKEDYMQELDIVQKYLGQRKFIAVGEIGIDLYWDKTYYKEQIDAFKIQIEWAMEHNLPIVIHSRESIDEILNLLEKWNYVDLKGVFHCFGGTRIQLDRIRAINFMIGIGGVVTFKNTGLREVLQYDDLPSIILETDAPYLAPVPYRGKRNEPAYIPIVAITVATALKIEIDEVATQTTENALKLFEMSHFF